MKQFLKKAAAAAVTLILTAGVLSPAVYGLRIYDTTAQDYPSFSVAQERTVPTESTLIVKTDGTLPDFRTLHPQKTVQGPDDTYTVTFSSVQEAADKLPDVCAMYGVEYAEPNARVVAQGDVQPLSETMTYGMDLMHCDKFAADLAAQSGLKSVVVAVVDSGVKSSLPIFAGRLTEGATMNGAPQTEDDYGHGTSVAGVVADCTQGLPVRIMPVRVLRADGTGTLLDAANGIRFAAENGAAIINISFVTENVCSMALHSAVDYALSLNALPIVSAGNYALDLDQKKCCPADYAPGFIVSGCDRKMQFYPNSCYGSQVDLCAPAKNVRCVSVYGTAYEMNGTSFAAPHISAIAAMYKLYMPDANRAALEKLLRLNTKDLGDASRDTRFGWGLPDLSALDGSRRVSASRRITNVRFESLPNKTTYAYKEKFSPDGIRLRVTYSDGSVEIRTTQGVQIYGFDNMTLGKHTIRAVFDGREATFDITVRYEWWQWLVRIFLFGWIWY